MKKIAVYLLYLLGLFLFLEMVFRICFPLPELANFNRINYQILDQTQGQSAFIRNVEMTWNSVMDTNVGFVHHLNRYGFRDSKEWKQEKDPGKKRVLFVGDSFVEGMMSDGENTIPSVFENLVNSDQVEVYNAGMMGIGLNEYIKFLNDVVPTFKPDEVILVLYSNDVPFQRVYKTNPIINPVKTDFWKSRVLRVLNGNFNEDPIPFQFLPANIPYHKAVPDPSNPWTFNEATMAPKVTPKIASAMKAGLFNFFRVNWILEEAKFLLAEIDVKDKLNWIKSYLEKYGCKLSIYYVPSRSQVSNYYYQYERQACLLDCPDFLDLTGEDFQKHAKIIKSNCEELGIPFYDFSAEIREQESKGNHLYWNYDDHMRAKGYRFLGNRIYENWKMN